MPDSEFFQRIGKKGGQAGKGSEAKLASATAAAIARWKRNRQRPVTLTVERGNVYFSRKVTGLSKALSMVEGKSDGKIIKWSRASLLFKHDGQIFARTTLLHRVRKFLTRQNITCKMEWKTKPFYQCLPFRLDDALADYNYRQQRVLRAVLKQPAGALCSANPDNWNWLLEEVLRITRPARGIVVVEKTDRLFELHDHLRHRLGEKVGLLTGQASGALLNQERITITVPAYVGSDIIPPDEVEIVVFDECPRTGYNQVNQALLRFRPAWRMARLDEKKRGHARMFLAEAAFGEVVNVSGALQSPA